MNTPEKSCKNCEWYGWGKLMGGIKIRKKRACFHFGVRAWIINSKVPLCGGEFFRKK